MSGTVINLADWRAAKVQARRRSGRFDAHPTAELCAFAQTDPKAKTALILRRIEEVAAAWGIDLEDRR